MCVQSMFIIQAAAAGAGGIGCLGVLFWGLLGRAPADKKKSHKKNGYICMIRGAQAGGVYGYTVHGICYAFSLGRRTAIFHHGIGTEPGGLALVGRIFEEEYQRDSWDTP